MTVKKLAAVMGALTFITVIGVVVVGAAFAQSDTPTPVPDTTPAKPSGGPGMGRGFGLGGPDSGITSTPSPKR